jgi:hypothetical protein
MGHLFALSWARLNSGHVVDSPAAAFYHRDIFHWSAPRHAQKELNLLWLAPSAVAQTGTRPSKVMRRKH